MLHCAALCSIKSFPCILTVFWNHNKDWTVLELISGIWIVMSSRDETQLLPNTELVLLMWKHASSVWWCNQFKAHHKKAAPYKNIIVGERGSCFTGAFILLISGPRTAPLLLCCTAQDGNTDFQVNAVQKIMRDLSIYRHTHTQRNASTKTCQVYVNKSTVSCINQSCLTILKPPATGLPLPNPRREEHASVLGGFF